jgi:purine nucleosidase
VKRVIFDTDIGIDDAMALLFLHRAPDVKLEAITTVSGNASIANTTRNALYVKERFGIDAPVFRGASGPIGPALGSGFPDFVHGKNGLGDIPVAEPEIQAELMSAPEAIVALAEAHPGEIIVIAVGRLTNLARAMELSPRLPGLLKSVFAMGGMFGYRGHRGNVSPVAEANMAGDPLAADRVLGAKVATTLVGLDVTHETTMDEAFIAALAEGAGDAGKFIRDITRYYFDFYEGMSGKRECPIHDSSAVACLLYPELYDFVDAPVRVVTEGVAMGQTILGERPESYASDAWLERPPCRVCVSVDGASVARRYLETLSRE